MSSQPIRKVVVIGLDGLEPSIVDPMLARGDLPNLARLAGDAGAARVATTAPAQTPVAWSTFATGLNPGGHGVFDFLRRDPKAYRIDSGLNHYEQKSALLPPKAVNQRKGETVWDRLSAAGVPSTILRCPCTYPPDRLRGSLLAGMGVPTFAAASAPRRTTRPSPTPRLARPRTSSSWPTTAARRSRPTSWALAARRPATASASTSSSCDRPSPAS